MTTVTLDRCRAHWFARQQLATPGPSDAVALVQAAGYLRTLGGIEAYLALRARHAGLTRADVDGALARRALQVLPAVRGCIYAVPEADVPLLLRFAAGQARKRIDKDLDKVGVAPAEMARVRAAVAEALADGGLLTTELRKALPDGVVRSLGAAGKKVGLSSPLPPALRLMEFDGEVERVLDGDVLEHERYRWRLAAPRDAGGVPDDPAGLLREVARRFFDWFGPATRDQLAAWSGAGKRDCGAAIEALELAPVTVEGWDREAYVPAADLEALTTAEPVDRVAALPMSDNLGAIHGAGALADPAHHDLAVPVWGRRGTQPLGTANQPQLRALVDGGELIGWWEVDPADGAGVWTTFAPAGERADAIEAEVTAAAAFVGALGLGRSFSLDTDEARAGRAAMLRTLRDGLGGR